MQRVFFEVFRYKEAPRRFMAEVFNDDVRLDDIKKRIEELQLGAWGFIFVAPKTAIWNQGLFQEIKLF
ncbi:unnamed protein product [marine sediment metagenome]|uniref:Uncharacterized protein n=1 Tax=marine sediment metagenome TaxID=412755 RepID=X1U567_9ZZZZ